MNTNTKRITHYITALVSIVVLVCIDQFTKYLVVGHLKDRPAYVLIRNIFQLEYLENRGAHSVYCKTRDSFTSVYS